MALYQQGDVLIRTIDEKDIPKKVKIKEDCHLAEGEATGHYHKATGNGVEVLTHGDDMYLKAPHGSTVTHQEHKHIKIPAGTYRVDKVREYDHFAEEARRVVD